MKEPKICEWSEESILQGDDYIEYDEKPFKDEDALGCYLLHKEFTKEDLIDWITDSCLDEFIKYALDNFIYYHQHFNTDQEDYEAHKEDMGD